MLEENEGKMGAHSLRSITDAVFLRYADRPDKLHKHLPFVPEAKSARTYKSNSTLSGIQERKNNGSDSKNSYFETARDSKANPFSSVNKLAAYDSN